MAHTPKLIRRAIRRAFKRSRTCTRLSTHACRYFWGIANQPE